MSRCAPALVVGLLFAVAGCGSDTATSVDLGDASGDSVGDAPAADSSGVDSSSDAAPDVCEAVTCSGRGACDGASGAAVCACESGYKTGADRKTCVPAICVPTCSGTSCVPDGCGGACGDCPCTDTPNAIIIVTEGLEVFPQTKLHLIGSRSFTLGGTIARHEWEVHQPVGSQTVFLPSFLAPHPTFEVSAAGTYVFRLIVRDDQGIASCAPAEVTVLVAPARGIDVELVWNTVGDADPTDEGKGAGADLDLHLTHPYATGEDVDGDGKLDGWFDQLYDCF